MNEHFCKTQSPHTSTQRQTVTNRHENTAFFRISKQKMQNTKKNAFVLVLRVKGKK
jgi:hypothetical protein